MYRMVTMANLLLLPKTYGSFFVLLCLVFHKAYAIVFLYIPNMEQLLETQAQVNKEIQARVPYLEKEKKRCVELYLTRSQIEHFKAMEDNKTFLENPINAYKLVKRLSVDLKYIEKITARNGNKKLKQNINVTHTAKKQLDNANIAILYLTIVYKLNVTELANGILRGNFSKSKQPFTDIFPPMTSTDCQQLAMAAYEYGDFDLALGWEKEALRKYNDDSQDDCFFDELESMMSISLMYNLLGDVKNSLRWLNESKSKGASKTELQNFENRVEHIRNFISLQSKLQQNTGREVSTLKGVWVDAQIHLCSAERRSYSRLTCQYRYGLHPFLRLARFKAELLHRDPDITMFHDVISDEEISLIQKLANAKFQEKKDKTCEIIYEKNTVSIRKSTCLNDSLSSTLKVVSRRATHISNLLTMANLTRLITVDYGVAGFHTIHVDEDVFAGDSKQCSVRFDTVVFYFNEVNQGGATIFTRLNLSVFPVKNSALYFRNLLPSGEKDLNLLHASCPVLHGTKWIGVKRLSG